MSQNTAEPTREWVIEHGKVRPFASERLFLSKSDSLMPTVLLPNETILRIWLDPKSSRSRVQTVSITRQVKCLNGLPKTTHGTGAMYWDTVGLSIDQFPPD